MKIKQMLFFAMLMGAYAFLAGGEASAQSCTGGGGSGNFTCLNESTTRGSTSLGFDPTVNLIPAVVNTDASSGPCFTCPNSNAGGTTAGALTNSMFGEIRDNNDADLGDQSYKPGNQGMEIPGSSECGSGCNDAGFFTFSIPLPVQNFLSAGTSVSSTNPSAGESVGRAGTKIAFSNDFTHNADGTTEFTQSVSQTTFIEGFSGNELQIATISSNATSPANASEGQSGGTINWDQTIQQGGFSLGPLSGSFEYGNSSFDGASAPTGIGQTNGDNTSIK